MLTLHIHMGTYHALPCWHEARKLTWCTRSLPEPRHYSIWFLMRNNSQNDVLIRSKAHNIFSKCPSQEKLTPNAQKELAQARVTRLARKETIRDSKKKNCSPYSRPLHIYKAMSCPRLPETSIFGETDQYVTIIQCCVTQTVQQNNEARKHKYCMGFHIHACYYARIKICHKSH